MPSLSRSTLPPAYHIKGPLSPSFHLLDHNCLFTAAKTFQYFLDAPCGIPMVPSRLGLKRRAWGFGRSGERSPRRAQTRGDSPAAFPSGLPLRAAEKEGENATRPRPTPGSGRPRAPQTWQPLPPASGAGREAAAAPPRCGVRPRRQRRLRSPL